MNFHYAQNAYAKTMINSSTSPLDLVIMLYDAAIESLNRTVLCIEKRDLVAKNKCISKVIAIVEELLSSLDIERGGQVAMNLQSIYVYILKEITIANAQNDIQRIMHIEFILKELRSAWRQIR